MPKKSRKRKYNEEERTCTNWERVNIIPSKVKHVMKTMWEIPQIFHFLLLTKESLSIPDLSMYEMERMFLIPRASKQMAQIMTSLLSPVSLHKSEVVPPLMPYDFWNNILACKMKKWFKLYDRKRGNAVKVLECSGIEPQFWNVFPDVPLVNGEDFVDLTLRQRVWLVKTICDTYLHHRKTVQDEIAKQPCENLCETVLGTDRHGVRYIYFPQFLKSDLRIYRQCLSNRILSSVKPKTKAQQPAIRRQIVTERRMSKLEKTKLHRRKSRWKKSLTSLSRRTVMKNLEKNMKRSVKERAAGSLINEDTNLSSTSSCGNNNNSNSGKNNMNLNTINGSESKGSSRCSKISIECNKAHCKNVNSSGDEETCLGFSSTSGDKCDIVLKPKTIERVEMDDSDVPLLYRLQNKMKVRRIDDLSNVSKTDDEKLNEMISAECLKLNGQTSNSFQVSTTSKSDDEKLNETRTDHSATGKDDINIKEGKREDKIEQNGQSVKKETPTGRKNDTDNSEIESDDEKDVCLSEWISTLQGKAMEDDFSVDEDNEMEYDWKINDGETNDRIQEAERFYKMLLELSVSKFQLVADSVSSLRRLISSFSNESSFPTVDTDNTNSVNNEVAPSCEVELVKNLKELLSSVEKMEPDLIESTKKAKEKLQRECINYKRSSMENPDSSGEGLNSNWWVVGSQRCTPPEDTTSRTLLQSALSSSCPQEKCVAEESSADRRGDIEIVEGECDTQQSENKSTEVERSQSAGEDNVRENAKINGERKEEGQQTRRVLRTRGISSYTEQLYSDEDIEEKELEEWTDIEATFAAAVTGASDSGPHLAPKVKQSDDQLNEEDSDQDWILPTSRRKKAKRPSASRRLKSFQHKLQSIKVDELQEAAKSAVSTSTSATQKPRVRDIQICNTIKPVEPQTSSANNTEEIQEALIENESANVTVPSTETSCKVENIASVHSELDIKDEGPIYDSTSYQFDNSYTANINPNYVMLKHDQSPMSYYVMQPDSAVVSQNAIMQPGSVVPNVVPPLQQGYYVQGEQNYIIQTPQSSFISPHAFQSQGPQMIAPEQFVNHPGYVPYMMTSPQSGFITTDSHIVTQGVPQTSTIPIHYNPTVLTRFPQNRYPLPRQNYPHPNGAVIRSTVPIRGHSPRNSNAKFTRNVPQQRGTPVRAQKPRNQTTVSESAAQKKTTSLIVLSDSDDEIEMIITEKTGSESDVDKGGNTIRGSNSALSTQKASSNATTPRNAISPQMIERMSQGGISITPVRPPQPVQNTSTQLVVVVNETGSHYALSLPNGGKLILTNEQVAQIRASNGGKLIL